jgi:hypothetical protein
MACRPCRARGAAAGASGAVRTSRSDRVRRAIRLALAAGQLAPEDATSYRSIYNDAVRLLSRLSGSRKRELAYVIGTLRTIAAKGRLSPPRMPALFLNLERNRQWWSKFGPPSANARIRFTGSRVLFQYYPGLGLQLQPLANFGVANAYWQGKRDTALRELADELVALRVNRGAYTTWEYYFDFGGGSPPWTSAMAQATGLQALARAGTRLGDPKLIEIARGGLGAFDVATPSGVRVPLAEGNWYALYSFSPGLQVLNGMLQTLIGLRTFADLTGDPHAIELFARGDSAARARIAAYDTGAWSLYSRSGDRPGAEANLNYHTLNRDFSRRLCRLTAAPEYCDAAEHFSDYLSDDPTLTPFRAAPAPARAGRGVRFHFMLSKVGRVGITVKSTTSGRTYLATSAFLYHGKHYFRWVPPLLRRERTYSYDLFARDLAGNSSSETGTIRVRPGR